MKGNNLKLIVGGTIAILLVIAGFYYYVAIYRNSSYNATETDTPNVEALSPSPGGASGGGGGGSLEP